MNGPAVLAIDDEPLILAAIEDALSEGSYAVTACPSGKDAMNRLSGMTMNFIGIVTDIKLVGEEISGWDVARRAREIFPSIGVVYISGDSEADWRARGVPDSSYIQKPFAAEQIVPALSMAIITAGRLRGKS